MIHFERLDASKIRLLAIQGVQASHMDQVQSQTSIPPKAEDEASGLIDLRDGRRFMVTVRELPCQR